MKNTCQRFHFRYKSCLKIYDDSVKNKHNDRPEKGNQDLSFPQTEKLIKIELCFGFNLINHVFDQILGSALEKLVMMNRIGKLFQ